MATYRSNQRVFDPPEYAISVQLRRLMESSYFKQFSSACVLINVSCMLFYHADASPSFSVFLSVQNAIFFAELCLELLLYCVAQGPGIFIEDRWRAFELILAFGSAYGYAQIQYIDGDLSSISVLFQVIYCFLRTIDSLRLIKSISEFEDLPLDSKYSTSRCQGD